MQIEIYYSHVRRVQKDEVLLHANQQLLRIFLQSHTIYGHSLTSKIYLNNFEPRPHVFVSVWRRNYSFADCLPVHKYLANTVTENGTFQNRFPEWKFFENAVFLRSCVRMKTELFKNAYAMAPTDVSLVCRFWLFWDQRSIAECLSWLRKKEA